MRRVLLPMSMVAVLVLGAACGGDDTDMLNDREQQAAQALAAEFQGNSPTAAQRDRGACLGKELVRRAGVDTLVESRMLTEDLEFNKDLPAAVPDEIATAYADTVVECQDVRADIEERASSYPEATADDMDAYVSCMESIDDDLLRQATLESTRKTGGGDASTAYLEATKPCTDLLGPARTPKP